MWPEPEATKETAGAIHVKVAFPFTFERPDYAIAGLIGDKLRCDREHAVAILA
jgi:hypothetical protein